MKQTVLHKLCIVLALVAVLPLALASVTGSTLAYLTDSALAMNSFTFENQPPLGQTRTDTVNYYYINKSGNSTRIQDSGYTNNTWRYQANDRIYADLSNTNIKTPPNGFRLSYITVAGNRVNAGSSTLQPNSNTNINVYFEPITYTITYDYNGYDESDIEFSHTPLQSTYTVFDMIYVPYEASTVEPYTGLARILCYLGGGNSIRCRDDVPTMEVDGNTLLGWQDQGGVVHSYGNASGSWSSDIGNISNNGVYNAFAARTSGNLTLTARWQYEVANNNNVGPQMLMLEPEELTEIEPDEPQEEQVENVVDENDELVDVVEADVEAADEVEIGQDEETTDSE